MIKLIINGIDYTSNANGIDELIESIEENKSDGLVSYGTSISITANGKLYNYLNEYFFADPCKGKENILKCLVKINVKKGKGYFNKFYL